MRPPRNGRLSLAKALDTKVLTLVRRFVEEQASDEPVLQLRLSAIYSYISADPSIARQKKANIEKSIERALDVIREEDAEDDELDSEFDGIDEDNIMIPDVVESNAVNRRITEMWSGRSGGEIGTPRSGRGSRQGTPVRQTSPEKQERPTPAPVTVETVVAESTATVTPAPPASPKRKRKAKDEEGRTKRVKADKENRDPPKNMFLKDLGGIDDAVNQLLEFVAFPLTHPEVYEYTGVPIPRGVLLHGPPGCGKTFLANALAGELGLPFIPISAPSIVSGMSGESEKKLRELFEEAREKAPCLMFIDEIDAITPKRESAQREMERRIVAQMLTCMDDLKPEKNEGKPVLIIGATNRPDSLDPALRRAGRFEKEICLTVPDEEAREKILRVLCKKLKLSGDFDYKTLAAKTPGFVGADLSALTAEAGRAAINRIFASLQTTPPEPLAITPPPNDNDMDIDPPAAAEPSPAPEPAEPTSLIQSFLAKFPAQLTPEQLAPLTITNADFLAAIPKIQPSSKREGFATVPDVTWSSIGALHHIRSELHMSIVLPIQEPALFSSVGLSQPTGVLLWGPPGCGKTLLAKAVANSSNANFISVKGPELLNKYVGESERAVRQVFSRAKASKPCIIFFDELDALVPRRDDSLSESSARVVNTLLTELDGLDDRRGVYVIAATNRPDCIDPAMLRPGRLDKPLFVDLPTPQERAEILKTLARKMPLDEGVQLEEIANDERCDCFSGADLSALTREATTSALRRVVFGAGGQDGERRLEVGSGEMVAGGAGAGAEAGAGGVREGVRVRREDFEKAFERVKPSVGREQRKQYMKLATKMGVEKV